MTIEEIQKSTEFQVFDRKSARIDAKALAITIIAFANADGGRIAIGVDRMFREMAEAGLPAPEYRQNEFMVYATIRQHGDAVTTEKTTEKILSLILENPNITTEELARITTEELARVCDMTPDGVYYHTKRLREKGLLVREGGRKEGHWVVVKKS